MGGDLHMKDKMSMSGAGETPHWPQCNTGYYYPFSKVTLPVIRTVAYATQYGTAVNAQDVHNLIPLVESLL